MFEVTATRVEASGSIIVEAKGAVLPHMTPKDELAGEHYTGARTNLGRGTSGGDVTRDVSSSDSGAGYDEAIEDGKALSECTER